MVVRTYNLSTGEVGAGESRAQDHLQLHSAAHNQSELKKKKETKKKKRNGNFRIQKGLLWNIVDLAQ